MGPDEKQITFTGIGLLALSIYFDSSVPLWQQFYKDGQLAGGGDGCKPLEAYLESLGSKCYDPAMRDGRLIFHTLPDCPTGYTSHAEPCACTNTLTCHGNITDPMWCNRHTNECNPKPCGTQCEEFGATSFGKAAMCEVKTCKGCAACSQSVDVTEDVEARFLLEGTNTVLKDTRRMEVGIDCPYYCDRDRRSRKDVEGRIIYWRKAQTFSKGAALFVQAALGTLVIYGVNYYHGGWARLMQCFQLDKMLRFGPVGICFGMCSVFSFLGQAALSPGSYSLYAQSGVVIIPILWRIGFCKPLAVVTWMHIVLIACGIIIYFLPNKFADSSDRNQLVGLMWIAAKVVGGALATIGAELFLKSGDPPPLTVSMSYILPWKAVGSLITCPILEADFWVGYNFRHNWVFHDWTFRLLLLVGHGFGDTCMAGVIAFYFDSVVKAICGVVGIICPTWIVSYLVGWELISVHELRGCVQIAGGLVVVTAAFAYAIGRAMASELQELSLKAPSAEPPTSLGKRLSVMRTEEAAERQGRQSCVSFMDAPTLMEIEHVQKDTETEQKRHSIRLSGASVRGSVEMADRLPPHWAM